MKADLRLEENLILGSFCHCYCIIQIIFPIKYESLLSLVSAIYELDCGGCDKNSQEGTESACQFRKCSRHGLDPCVGKILWNRKWQSTSVFLPGKFPGQRSLVGYSSRGHKELDTTEHTHADTQRESKGYEGKSGSFIHSFI